MDRQALGRYGEQLAVEHLQDAGFEVLARNWRCDRGELDVVARTGSTVVFASAPKTRSTRAYGQPVEQQLPAPVDPASLRGRTLQRELSADLAAVRARLARERARCGCGRSCGAGEGVGRCSPCTC